MATLTRAQMLALLADNTTGDISAQDMRDIVTGIPTFKDEFTDVKNLAQGHERQLNFDTSKLGVNIDTIMTSGYYEVDTNLPYGLTLGELRVGYDTTNTSRIIQEFSDGVEPASYRRQYNGTSWTPWQETPQSSFNDDVVLQITNLINIKADYEYVNRAIINTYTGFDFPQNTLGKDGDKYHKFATEAPTNDMLTGLSASAYAANSVFGLFFDPVATGAQYLAINPATREVFFEYGSDGFPKVNDINMEIDGNSVVLTIKNQTAIGVTLEYNNSYDSIIQSIQVNTPFKMTSRGLSGVEADYLKSQGRWFFQPIFNRTFDHAEANGIVISDAAFVDIINTNTTSREAGVYKVTVNVNANYSSTVRSMKFRYSLDGTNYSPIVWKEPKDQSDTFVLTDVFIYTIANPAAFTMQLQGTCESGTDVLDINFASFIIERMA